MPQSFYAKLRCKSTAAHPHYAGTFRSLPDNKVFVEIYAIRLTSETIMSFDSLRRARGKEVSPSEIEVAEEAIEKYGYSENDFTVVSEGKSVGGPSALSRIGRLTFLYEPTGKKREYQSGSTSLDDCSTWVAEFEQDLQYGYFKDNVDRA